MSITDDDVPAGTVSLVLTPATIDESGSSNVSTVTATLATASSADTTVTISAPQDAPVALSSNKTLTIVKGAATSTGEVTISAVNDAVYTGDREVTVSGAASNEVGVANPEDATLTITDDEVRPVTASFGSATYSVAEGGAVDVTVTLDAAPEREVTIPITATDQGGASADDYSGVPASVTFGATETEKSFSIAAAADDVDDDGESVALAFGTLPAAVTAGTTNTATVSILAADASSSSIQVLFYSSSYSATEGGNDAQVTVLLSSQPQSTIDIPLTATGASGATEDDWSGVPASLTFNPGDTSQTFTVIATDDDVEDDGEMVHLVLGTLPEGFVAGSPATATITIMNDDSGTPDSACPGAVWCATLTFSSEGYLGDNRQAFLGWHYEAGSVSNTGATLTDSQFMYRAKDYSIIGIWVFTPPHDRSTCTSELQMNIHSSDGLLADLDLFESLDASKGLKLIVDDYLEFPITVDTKRHPHMMGFLHPYFYSIRAGSTVELRIEETDIASSGGDGAAGDVLAKPRCVHVSSYPHNTPETGLVGLEITWQKPSLDGSPNILSGAANVDSYKVQWKKKVDSWDDPSAVSEERISNALYHVILGLTEGVNYSVRVIATNGFGDSPPSEEATGAPMEVVRPELSTATANGNALTLAYSEPLDANSAPEIDSFEVTVAGAKRDVAEVTVEGNAVVLTLGEAVGPDDEIELNYFPAWYIEEGRIQDDAGNVALGFVDQSVTNNTEAAAQAQAAEEVTPLTATFSDAPGSHNGQDAFTFRIAFSEPIATSYEVVRDQALEVTGGSVAQARRVDGRSDLWEIKVEPGSNADVTVALHPDRACDAEGAICTGDGKRLSNGLGLLVPGPIVRQGPEPNRPATGSPTIAGTLRVGELLTVDTTDIVDEDGLDNATYSYQWLADGTLIKGATESTYTLTSSDSGKIMTVRASFTDDAGHVETLTSAATAAVAAKPNSAAIGAPTISGTAKVGETLTADTSGIADTDGLDNATFNYQWLADGADIAGATDPTYTLSVAEEGKAISVRVSFTDDAGHMETLTSAATAAVAAKSNSAATGAPTISGTAKVGETLTADTSGVADTDGLDNATFSYQWLADGADITGATDSTYTLSVAEEGKAISVRVSFTDDAGHVETLTSAATAAVAAKSNSAATGAPTISGTAKVGETLTADTSGVADTDGLDNSTFNYQWLADGADITGATGATYTLSVAEEGKAITVRVSFTDDAGHVETLTSAATAAVAAKSNSAATGAPAISGTAKVGETLTADTSGVADTDGLDNSTFNYQWLADGADITGATDSTYTLSVAEEGKAISVRVSFTDDAGHVESLTSAATAAVAAKSNSAATGAPTISGTAKVGETLTADTSGIADTDGLDNATFNYQWLADGAEIDGATGATYTLSAAEEGKAISVRVSFTDDAGHVETLTSAATSAVRTLPQLTAGVDDAPESHDGEKAFTFELRFSEEPESDFSYKTLRDHAFTVVRGEVIEARRLERPSNVRWQITVRPTGNGDVDITLPETTDCSDDGAICTEDERKLSNKLVLTVSGPGG